MRELIRQSRAPIASLARAGSTTALIALGINLFRFEVKGEKPTDDVRAEAGRDACGRVRAGRLLDLPPIAVVLFDSFDR